MVSPGSGDLPENSPGQRWSPLVSRKWIGRMREELWKNKATLLVTLSSAKSRALYNKRRIESGSFFNSSECSKFVGGFVRIVGTAELVNGQFLHSFATLYRVCTIKKAIQAHLMDRFGRGLEGFSSETFERDKASIRVTLSGTVPELTKSLTQQRAFNNWDSMKSLKSMNGLEGELWISF